MAFVMLLALAWIPVAVLIAIFVSNPSHRDLGFLVWLLIAFLGIVFLWEQWLYQRPAGFGGYGLRFNQGNGALMLQGWLVGSLSLVALFVLEGMLGWLTWQGTSLGRLIGVGMEGVAVAIAVALGEELVFRGWLLNELDRDYSPIVSVWASSLTFAVLHFIKPLNEVIRTFPQFPGLVVLGLILVWARRSSHGYLGLSIGLHGGLVWGYYLIQVGALITIHSDAPERWVGIDQNPLAGGLGLLSLGAIAFWVRQRPCHLECSKK
jgi:hypothetical protein